jgi:hypothetical protein
VEALELPDLLHAPVRVDLVAGEEAIRVLAQRPLGGLDAVVDTDHRALDAVLVHFLERELQEIRALRVRGDVLEHVLGRHLERLAALAIHELGFEESVPLPRVLGGNAHHQIDDTDVFRHAHGSAPRGSHPPGPPRAAAREDPASEPRILLG